MWKDFFYFSKGQRAGIIVLLVLVVAALIINIVLPRFYENQKPDSSEFIGKAKRFKNEMLSRDSLKQIAWEKKYKKTFPSYSPKPKQSYSLFPFDPNKTDSAGFVRLGLPPFIVANILKSRKQGYRFKNRENFATVYGLKPEKYQELEPYIVIEEIEEQTITDTVIKKAAVTKLADIIVDLNSADTTELLLVPGIGKSYARRILAYRQKAGGFVSVEQLREIEKMNDENFKKISPHCKIDMALVKQIRLNTASVQRLYYHPYIKPHQAQALYELRRRKGKLKSIDELKSLKEFEPEGLEKLKPYLNFE